MGRQDYLTRLALGRSAFQPLNLSEQPLNLNDDGSQDEIFDGQESTTAVDSNAQRYDKRGRPTSEAAAKLNAELRHAQNEVLELVNIVERQVQSPDLNDQTTHQQESQRARRKSDEDLDELFKQLITLCTWYPETLLHRSLAGVYDPATPFSQVVAADVSNAIGGTWDNAESIILPGILYVAISMTAVALPELIEMITMLVNKRLRRRGKPALTPLTQQVGRVMSIAAQASLLPVQHLAVAARLGLIRPTSFRSTMALMGGYYSLCNAPHGIAFYTAAAIAHSLLRNFRLSHITAKPADVLFPLHALGPIEHVVERAQVSAESRQSSRRALQLPSSRGSTVKSRGLYHAALVWWHTLHTTVRKRILHLPFELLALQCSARVFDFIIFGPGRRTHGLSMPNTCPPMPIFSLPLQTGPSTIACLQATSKIGLALCISLGTHATLRCLYDALKQSHGVNDLLDQRPS